MTGLALSLVFQAVLLAPAAQPYDQAYAEASKSEHPLLVLVGAEWCPGCRTMKHSVLARMGEAGRLKNVSYAVVNTDAESALASRLMRGGTIPQLIVFSKTATGWHREQITGATSDAAVEALIGRAISAQPQVAQPQVAATAPETTPVRSVATGGN
jgi:thioredoxin-like negative regulator of GroEL